MPALIEVLTDHYHNYPDAPEGFPEWHNVLIRHLENAFLRYKENSSSAPAEPHGKIRSSREQSFNNSNT